jgi:hypothetical protein
MIVRTLRAWEAPAGPTTLTRFPPPFYTPPSRPFVDAIVSQREVVLQAEQAVSLPGGERRQRPYHPSRA